MPERNLAIPVGLAILAFGILFTAMGMMVVSYFLFELGLMVAFVGAVIALVGTLGWARRKSRQAPQSPRPQQMETEKGED